MEKRPEDYLRLSDAYSRLADGMWGGLPRAEAVRAIRRRLKIEPAYGEIYFGYGPWRERAADCLTRAALVGKLTVHVVKDRTFDLNSSSLGNAAVTHHIDAMVVPVKILRRLAKPRSGLPDHPFRPTHKIVDGDGVMLDALLKGVLVVREREFAAWYRSERAKGKWASQRSKKKRRIGRPSKQTDELRNAVMAMGQDGTWNRQQSVTELRGLLAASDRTNLPSADTLTRLVDQLHVETGDPGLRRPRRRKASRAKLDGFAAKPSPERAKN
jgi:hypothetical protein